jgi:predicted RNA-binding Zn-ribbon protein involved in translation (DUF1610 family)
VTTVGESTPVTHDTPGESSDDLRWCEQCELTVDPAVTDDGLACPACGAVLDSTES